jgi:aminopeptidase-like protein
MLDRQRSEIGSIDNVRDLSPICRSITGDGVRQTLGAMECRGDA